jgi:hypothetical protein
VQVVKEIVDQVRGSIVEKKTKRVSKAPVPPKPPSPRITGLTIVLACTYIFCVIAGIVECICLVSLCISLRLHEFSHAHLHTETLLDFFKVAEGQRDKQTQKQVPCLLSLLIVVLTRTS